MLEICPWPQPRKHIEICHFHISSPAQPLSCVSIASPQPSLYSLPIPSPCWWHSENPTHIPQLLHLEQRSPGTCLCPALRCLISTALPSPASNCRRTKLGAQGRGLGNRSVDRTHLAPSLCPQPFISTAVCLISMIQVFTLGSVIGFGWPLKPRLISNCPCAGIDRRGLLFRSCEYA